MGLFKRGLIGIDIGTSCIRLAESNAAGKIVRLGIAPTPEGALSAGAVHTPLLLADALKAAIKSGGIHKHKPCSLLISGPQVQLRSAVLPYMQADQLYNNIVSEISSYLPISPQKYYIDYRVQHEMKQEDSHQLKVLIAAVPKEVVDAYLYCMASVGLNHVRAVDVAENAWEKLVRHTCSQHDVCAGAYGVVDMGLSHTLIGLYAADGFVVNKASEVSGSQLYMTLASHLGISPTQAREQLMSALPNPQPPIQGILADHLAAVTAEIRRVIDFYRYRSAGQTLQCIYLCGGFSHLEGIVQALEQELSLPVLPMSTLLSTLLPNVPPQPAADWAGAVAATLREDRA